jgi:hypothetical protein
MGERRILRLEFLLTANFFRYFMFAASLVVLMNQFSSLYQTNDYAETMSDAIKIVEYCAVEDPQARRVLDIIQRFSQVVTTWTKDHAYPTPPLSSDFSCLSVPAVRPAAPTATMSQHGSDAGDLSRRSSAHQLTGAPIPGLPPTTPAVAKAVIRDPLASSQPTDAMLEAAAINGATSPQQVRIPMGAFVGNRASISGPSSMSSAEAAPNGDIEVDFGAMWNHFINYLPPVSTVASGITSFAVQFPQPPPVLGPPTEVYGVYSTPQPIGLNRT